MFNVLPAPRNPSELAAGRIAPFKGWDVYQDVFYSTLTYPQAGQPVGTPLTFFAGTEGVGGNTNLTNVASANALVTGGHSFHGLRLFFIPLVENTTVAVAATLDGTGRVRDIDRVVKTNRPIVSYTSTRINKSRGNIPLDFLGEAGGILPDFGGNNVPAAGNNAVYQHGRLAALGGWPVDLIVNENEGINVNVTWGVQTAIEVAMSIRMAILGWHYVQIG